MIVRVLEIGIGNFIGEINRKVFFNVIFQIKKMFNCFLGCLIVCGNLFLKMIQLFQ